MVRIKIEKKDNQYHSLSCEGHAGFARMGKDIVCAAVSVLVINTVNAIDSLTGDRIDVDANAKTGKIRMVFTEPPSAQGTLLMDALVMGLSEVEKEYGKRYLSFRIRQKK